MTLSKEKISFLIFISLFLQACSNPQERLMTSIDQGDAATVAVILDNKTVDINAPFPKSGRTPLGVAASRRRLSISRRLLNAGANVDIRGREGYTPLLWASSSDDPVLARLLIRNGADVNARNDLGRTPLWISFVGEKSPEMKRLLLQYGADVNVLFDGNRTILMELCRLGDYDGVKEFLELTPNVNIASTDCMGEDALAIARKSHDRRIAKLIEQYLETRGGTREQE